MVEEKTKLKPAVAKARAAKAREKALLAKSKVKEKSTTHANGFMTFIREQGVVGLAVGLVLGGAVTILVKSLIENIVMPPLGFILGSAEGLKGLTVTLGKTPAHKEAVLHYGVFLNDVINFLVIALIIYLVVHILGFDKKIDKKKEKDA